MRQLWKCIFGPNLYKIYSLSQYNDGLPGRLNYNLNSPEQIGGLILKGLNVLWNIGLYTLPCTLYYIYRNRSDYFCITGCLSIAKIAASVTLLYIVAILCRGVGRFSNPVYKEFLNDLIRAREEKSASAKRILAKYDFEFFAWPIDFSSKSVSRDRSVNAGLKESYGIFPCFGFHSASAGNFLHGYLSDVLDFPFKLLTFCCVRLFGRHLIYPGSIQLIQLMFDPHLMDGREKLVKIDGGERNKILTRDGNEIDTMFIDKRSNDNNSRGSTLVLCCEGNAGFYELGLLHTPLKAGYSVLGWNHPGFAGSSGSPFPSQEREAVQSVMEFAIHKLGFDVSNIIIYAWSIGGFTGTWAAVNFPEVRGLILDATFDDILPLALPRMPYWMSWIVEMTIRFHMDLDIAHQLTNYTGPITIIRRTQDEIITTTEGNVATNRGNFLLKKVLKARYPWLCNSIDSSSVLHEWVSADPEKQDAIYNELNVNEEHLIAILRSHIEGSTTASLSTMRRDMDEEDKTKLLLFLAKKIFVNFDSSHNNPLSPEFLQVPWTL